MRSRWALLVAAVVALAAVGAAAWSWPGPDGPGPNRPGGDGSSAVGDELLRPVIAGQQALILADHRSGPRDLVIVLHGLGGSAGLLQDPRALDFTRRLVDRGIVVAASDAHGDAWGDAASQADYVRLHRYVAHRFDVDRTVLVSVSMGAVAGLQLVADHAVPHLAGWLGVAPVIDLQGAARTRPLQGAIDLGSRELRALDPSGIPTRALAGVPMAVTIAPDDTVVSVPAAEGFARRVGADLLRCDGGHAAGDCFRAGVVEAMLR